MVTNLKSMKKSQLKNKWNPHKMKSLGKILSKKSLRKRNLESSKSLLTNQRYQKLTRRWQAGLSTFTKLMNYQTLKTILNQVINKANPISSSKSLNQALKKIQIRTDLKANNQVKNLVKKLEQRLKLLSQKLKLQCGSLNSNKGLPKFNLKQLICRVMSQRREYLRQRNFSGQF